LSDKVIKAENVKILANPLPHRLSFLASRETKGSGAGARDKAEESSGKSDSGGPAENPAEAGKEAYERGFAEGAAGQENQSLQAMKALHEILREAGDRKRKFYAEAEAQMLSLVLAVAEKVVCDEIATNDKIILAVLKEAVKNVVDREGMKIHLNPQDFRYLMDRSGDLPPELKNMKNLTFEEDEGIKQGGAVLETLSGEVDARLEQRLQEVKSALEMKGHEGGR